MLRSAFILPGGAYGSLGDEAAVLGLARGYDRYRVGMRNEKDWPGYDRAPMSAAGVAGCTHVLAIGADVFDGSFQPRDTQAIVALLRAAPQAARAVVGFSFRPDASAKVRELVATLPADTRFVPRDARSLENFAALTGRGGALLGADPAFLMQAEPDFEAKRPRLARWIEARRRESRRVVGLNANALLSKGPQRALTQALLALPARFADVAFVLIPHDLRNDPNDRSVLAEAAKQARANTALVALRPAEVKALCARLDFVITARMHVAIAALGCGKPAAVVDYNHKVEGLLDHFGQADMAIESSDQGRIEAAFRELLRDAATRQAQVAAKLPEVMELARRNWV